MAEYDTAAMLLDLKKAGVDVRPNTVEYHNPPRILELYNQMFLSKPAGSQAAENFKIISHCTYLRKQFFWRK